MPSSSSSNSSSSSGSANPVPTLLSVAFGGGYDLIDDVVLPFTPPASPVLNTLSMPHWQQSPTGTLLRDYPYLYKGGIALKIVYAVWLFDKDLPSSAEVWVKATCNITDFTFSYRTASIGVDRRTVTVTNYIANAGLMPSHTACFDPLTLDFTLSITGIGGQYLAAGKSTNRIYVCLPTGNPEATGLNRFQTTVHLACFFGLASSADEAVINTFSGMSGLSVKRWNWATKAFDVPLYYYRRTTPTPPWETTSAHNATGSVVELLANPWRSGQCSCWAALMRDALIVNGITVRLDEGPGLVVTQVLPDTLFTYDGFIVKNLAFQNDPGQNEWLMKFADVQGDMMPPPYPNTQPYNYFEIDSTPGLDGQNSDPLKSPSQKVFTMHVILKYTDAFWSVLYYDPSYGITHTSPTDFQNKVAGFFDFMVPPAPPDPDPLLIKVKKTVPAVLNIRFSPPYIEPT